MRALKCNLEFLLIAAIIAGPILAAVVVRAAG
jgi:hypothetical protein